MDSGSNVDFSAIDFSIILPPFLAGVLVLLTHVPLGAQVLRRGIVFIDLAIAQIAALGVIIAGILNHDAGGISIQLAAGTAAILGALLLTWAEKRWPEVQEAQIGVLFVLAATAGILLLSGNPHGGEHLRDLLAGQILWVSYSQLITPTCITVLIVSVLVFLHGKLNLTGFYLIFAIAVTASVQLVGVYLVFASLIIPSLATRHYRQPLKLPFAYLTGLLGYAAGLGLSTFIDLPAGAAIVWCLTIIAILIYSIGPSRIRI